MTSTRPSTCPRHPDVETRLRCSACDTLICPACGREAAVGYQCPDCAGEPPTPSRAIGLGGRRPAGRARSGGSAGSADAGGRLPTAIGARAVAVGLAAASAGGLLLGPIMIGGTFLLISSGALGWLVARAVYWGTGERNAPFVRAVALTCSGFTVAVALAFAGASTAPAGMLFLAYPAAVYGGWIVVRRR